jgi:uncharacterized cupin superfamily protein
MAKEPPKVDLSSVDLATIGNGKQFSATVAKLGGLLGMTKIGCTVVELEPGKRAWPYHLHFGQEEVFLVLEGHGTLRYDDDEYEIREGEIFSPGIG